MKKIWIVFLTALCLTFGTGQSVQAKSQQVSFSFPIKIKWGSTGLVKGQKYRFVLKGLKHGTPMPKGAENEEYTIAVTENDRSEYIPKILYTHTGDYHYKLTLYRDKDIVIKVYYFHIQVLNGENGKLFLVTSIRKNSEAGQKIANLNFLDIGEDEPWKEEQKYHKHDHDQNRNKNSKNIKDKNYKEDHSKNNGQSTQKQKRITKNTRTGDDMKVEFYLFTSIISLGILLIIGCKKISHRE